MFLHWHKNSTVTARLFSDGKIVEKRLIARWEETEDVFASVVTMASDYANRIVTPETLDLYHQVLAWYPRRMFLVIPDALRPAIPAFWQVFLDSLQVRASKNICLYRLTDLICLVSCR